MMISKCECPGMSGSRRFPGAPEAPRPSGAPSHRVADIRNGVTAMRDGSVNYLAKPIDIDNWFSPSGRRRTRRGQPGCA